MSKKLYQNLIESTKYVKEDSELPCEVKRVAKSNPLDPPRVIFRVPVSLQMSSSTKHHKLSSAMFYLQHKLPKLAPPSQGHAQLQTPKFIGGLIFIGHYCAKNRFGRHSPHVRCEGQGWTPISSDRPIFPFGICLCRDPGEQIRCFFGALSSEASHTAASVMILINART